MNKTIWNKLEDKKPAQNTIVLASDGINICMSALDNEGVLKLAQFSTYKNEYVLFLDNYKDNTKDEVIELIYWTDVPGVPGIDGKTMNQYTQERKKEFDASLKKYKEIKEIQKTNPVKAEQLFRKYIQERDE